MLLKAIEFITLVLTALVTGVFWGTWFTLTRSLDTFSPAEFIHIGKTIIGNVGTPMSILMPATLAAMLLAIFLAFRVRWTDARNRELRPYLYIASFLLMIVTLVITLTVLVPIDGQIASWTPETIPSNYPELRGTWDSYHTARTFTSIASFAAFALGAVTGQARR
jgi:uncharacterized membrane protein